MSDKQNIEEHLVSQVAEKSVSSQLDTVEEIDIQVQTDIFKLAQGQADGVTFAGQGLVTKQNIRVQEIKIQTDTISINPLRAIFGQIQLEKPVNVLAQIKLTEADINSALSADFTHNLVQSFDLDVDGEIISFALQHLEIFLPNDEQIGFNGIFLLTENNNSRPLSFTAILRPRTPSQSIMLESFHCTQGGGISLEIIVSLMQKVKELVNLPYFVWEGMKITIKDMQIQEREVLVLVMADVKQIPATFTEIST
ncbi:DUF2993 domain-containing protein [Nostoc sp. TCL26-01]|uniref:LmeA family phospholipid-binding protein n=1 Tax=Nostoc sp. TCL26-01 TaxID=2576904 RepID=UPI0015C0A073|nr:DUF2993 domain-containing protein [Nostoc sp. TCL26-01]QLE55787.1 DUF2993 domain-containing protein [Nostoc sp. TCL26-01]